MKIYMKICQWFVVGLIVVGFCSAFSPKAHAAVPMFSPGRYTLVLRTKGASLPFLVMQFRKGKACYDAAAAATGGRLGDDVLAVCIPMGD